MTLEPLTALSIGGTSEGPGRPPHLGWLAISTLRTNPAYQRPISAKGRDTIAKIVAGFSWGRFSPLIVRQVPGSDPLYEIIDGQHRATAALSIGYERVPAMIVQASDEEAARIFASVNGTVTPMSPLAVYKAALAGGEQWALDIKAAAEAAGCKILRYPVPFSQQKPFQTQSIGTIRKVWQQTTDPRLLPATFKLLVASVGSDARGFLTSSLIQNWSRILASRPGWIANIDSVCEAMRLGAIDLMSAEAQVIEAKLAQRIGDGRSGQSLNDIKAKVKDMLNRKIGAGIIATSMRLPYRVVEDIIAEIRRESPR